MVDWGMFVVDAVRKVLYWLYRPPYIANNMVDLLKLIKTKPLKFPSSPKIS